MGIEKQQVNQVCLATNFCEIACVGKDYLKFWKKKYTRKLLLTTLSILFAKFAKEMVVPPL